MAVARDETTVEPCWASPAAATYRSGRTMTNPTGWAFAAGPTASTRAPTWNRGLGLYRPSAIHFFAAGTRFSAAAILSRDPATVLLVGERMRPIATETSIMALAWSRRSVS